MTRVQGVLILPAVMLTGLLPILLYGMEHGGLAALPIFESVAMILGR